MIRKGLLADGRGHELNSLGAALKNPSWFCRETCLRWGRRFSAHPAGQRLGQCRKGDLLKLYF